MKHLLAYALNLFINMVYGHLKKVIILIPIIQQVGYFV